MYRESVQQLRQAQLQQQQSMYPTGTYRKHRGGQKVIPPPHQQAMQKQIQQEQLKEQQQIGRERRGQTPEQTSEKQLMDSQAGQQSQQMYAAQVQAKHQAQAMYEAQKAAAKQQLQAQKLYQQQQLLLQHHQQHHQHPQQLQQTSIMKSGKHTHGSHQHPYHHASHTMGHSHHVHPQQQLQPQQQQYFHSQYFPPVISPPEGFQSDTPFDPMTDTDALDLARRLHAKAAQVYATEPRQRHHHSHEKRGEGGKKKKDRSHRQASPVVIDTSAVSAGVLAGNNDDSYELCVASDAELHTIGQTPVGGGQGSTTHYFSLPRSHVHHRPASASPRNVQTLMRQPQSLYRRNEEYGYNYTA